MLVLEMLALLILGAMPHTAVAHGGLSIDDDKCKLKVGPYSMHFTGYQPSSNGSREFCEDIPQTGQTVIVMDMVDDVLREMPVEVRIIRDTGDETRLDAITLFHLPPKVYPAGSIPLEYNFDQPGKYIGLVSAGDKRQHLSRFPFSVGVESNTYGRYLLIILAPLLGFLLYLYSARVRRRMGQDDAGRKEN
ncbi:MAG: hypothetical protein WC100_13805 [Sterolibacterium sp.]